MNNLYSPYTMTHIKGNPETAADWMGKAKTDAPEYDPQTHECYFRDGAWVVEKIPGPDIDEMKAQMVAAIDRTTERIRDRDGMLYMGKRFSMSLQAQANWTKLALGIIAGLIQFPYEGIQTIDDEWFVLQTKEQAMGFVMATAGYENAPDSPVRQGRDLKALVAAAQTVEELEAIKDERE